MDSVETCSISDVSKFCMATDLGLECVCSKRAMLKVGIGTTTKKEDSTIYYYARQIEDDLLSLQSLNAQWAPSGPVENLSLKTLVTEYQPEVDLFLSKVKPVLQQIAKAVAKGDQHRAQGQPYSALLEYRNALGLDEKNVRALFGLGLTYLQYNQHDKARLVFEELITLDGFTQVEYKHLFNEFGMELRKQNMTGEAILYYSRAIELCSIDENLYFNLARALFQGQQSQEALQALDRCLDLSPSHTQALSFKAYLLAAGPGC